MSKNSTDKTDIGETMRDEYDFDYAESRQNRFASELKKAPVVVVEHKPDK